MNFHRSSLYQNYKEELAEINKHKWIESEKVGYDIGFEKALLDWVMYHKKKFKEARENRASDV